MKFVVKSGERLSLSFLILFVAVPVILSPNHILFCEILHGTFSLLLLTFFSFSISQITIFCEITHGTVSKLKFGIHFWITSTSFLLLFLIFFSSLPFPNYNFLRNHTWNSSKLKFGIRFWIR